MTTFKHIVFDWGDTLMTDDKSQTTAMYTWPTVYAVAGAKETLHRLAKTHILSVATSAAQSDEEMVRKALRRVGLDQYISRVFTGRTVGRKKADPDFWTHIQTALGADQGKLLVVGDSFESDVLPPVEAGLNAIWFNLTSEEDRSGKRYATIHQLEDLVEMAEPNAAPLPSEGAPSEGM